MTRGLARVVVRERVAGARHRGLVNEAKRARRAERRERRRATGRKWRLRRLRRLRWLRWLRWLRRPGVPVDAPSTLNAAPAPLPEDVTEALANVLNAVAERIAEHGTAPDRLALHAVHDATRWSAPGAAAALVDWDGSETARLRAFGVLHGVALRVLGLEDRAWLLDRLQRGSAQDQADWVA